MGAGWCLTEAAAKNMLIDIKRNGVGELLKLVEAQRRIKNEFRAKARIQDIARIRDEGGLFSRSRLQKLLKEEKMVSRVEKKYGVKRVLRLAVGETKGDCRICKKRITANYWQRHIDSQTHMKKALKLN